MQPERVRFIRFGLKEDIAFGHFGLVCEKNGVGRYTKLLQFLAFVQLPLSFDFGLSTFLLSNEII